MTPLQVVEKKPDFFRGDKLPPGTQILYRWWPEGWMQGEVLGRSHVRGKTHRVEFTDGETHDMELYDTAYAFGADQPPSRVGIWCRLEAAGPAVGE